jgi:hypothetical protein
MSRTTSTRLAALGMAFLSAGSLSFAWAEVLLYPEAPVRINRAKRQFIVELESRNEPFYVSQRPWHRRCKHELKQAWKKLDDDHPSATARVRFILGNKPDFHIYKDVIECRQFVILLCSESPWRHPVWLAPRFALERSRAIQ